MGSIVQGLHDIEITRYAQLASSVIIAFDHIITLEDEFELIWKSSWTVGKILFLLNRYYSLGAVLFNNYAILAPVVDDSVALIYSCLAFFRWQGWTGMVSCVLAEAILQMRLYALYSLNKKILALMLTCWIACLATSAYILFTVLSHVTASAIYIPRGMFCVPQGFSSHFFAFWIPMLSFECLLCSLALIRGFQTYRSEGSLFHSSRQLVGILVRDSILYFLVICAAYLTCLLIWILASVYLMGVPIGFSVALSCVLANRVVLNVREVNREVNASKLPVNAFPKRDNFESQNISNIGTLSEIELEQLRTMKAESHYGDIVDMYCEPADLPFVVL